MSTIRAERTLLSVVLLGCVAVTVFWRLCFPDGPPARFSDLYLIAILIVAYRATVPLALFALGVSLILCVYLLVPLDSSDLFQLTSYLALSLLVLWITRRLRR